MKSNPSTGSVAALLKTVTSYLTDAEQATIQNALTYAAAAHDGYWRKSGDPYVEHPIAVASILAEWRAPTAVLVTSLLHDTHKPNYSRKTNLLEIEQLFGREVGYLMSEVSQLGRLGHIYPAIQAGMADAARATDAELSRRLPWVNLVLQRSPLAIVIKLADRLHNLQTIHVHSERRQIEFAAYTQHIFVPLAERLGMRAVKRQLEDDAFRILQPDAYGDIAARYPWQKRQQAAQKIIEQIEQHLQTKELPAEIILDPNSFYNIYQFENMIGRHLPLELAQPVIILVDKRADCYCALGYVHQLWTPEPERFRDYVAAPKPNGYRALHTQLRFTSRHNLIVLLRDKQMHLVAEYGLAAQWQGVPSEKLPHLPQRTELPSGKITVLTPDGDLVLLPEKATPVDFAYSIHKSLGHQCIGAMVNGRMASLSHPLHSGDIVHIRVSRASVGPSSDWLEFVQTPRARAAIRRWIQSQNPVEAADLGWKKLDEQLRRQGILLSSGRVTDRLQLVAEKLGYQSRSELLIAVGLKKREAGSVVAELLGLGVEQDGRPFLQAVVVSLANGNLPHRFARCCNPEPPDPIVGYETRTKVIKIHRADCERVGKQRPLLNAEWASRNVDWQSEIDILAIDRQRLVYDVSKIIAEAGLTMNSFYADRIADGSAQIRIAISQLPPTQLNLLLKRLQNVADVRQAELSTLQLPENYNKQGVMAHHFSNPYTLRPVTGSNFFGRRKELLELVNNLRDVRPGEAVLLWGPRRIGKTSLLLEFKANVVGGDDFLPVFVDLQRLSGRSTTMFLLEIARAIVKELGIPGLKPPNLSRMKRDPLGYFSGLLERLPALQDKLLVLIFDEFQLLAELREEEVSLADINRYFRGMIQHQQGLSIVFSGGGLLDDLLRHPETSFMLEVARHQRLTVLEEKDARKLIVESVSKVFYAEEAVVLLLELTAGHPYFMQWICSELVTRAEGDRPPQVSAADVVAVLTDWVPHQSEHFFNHLWGHTVQADRKVQQINKLALTVMAVQEKNAEDYWLSFTQIYEGGLYNILDKDQAWHVLQGLVKMDTLESVVPEQYRIKVPLCTHWLRHNYDVQRVVKEINHAQ
ncbi:MAG: HD domain-containing protein [Anaerolineae bacterium]|nr:HD domain-containing protein [Anaerolineae bacterium]